MTNPSNVMEEIGRLADYVGMMYQRKPQEAVETVEAMAEILRKVDTDDDDFPEFIISELYRVIGREKSYDEILEILGRG